jgi:hypothetical protein
VTRAGRPAAALAAVRRRDGCMIKVLIGSVGDPLGDAQSGSPVGRLAAAGAGHRHRSLDLPGARV